MDVSLSELRELVMDREAWRAAIHGVAKSWMRLSDWTELNVATRKFDLHMCLTSAAWVSGSHPVSLGWRCCRASFLHPWWVRCYPPEVRTGDRILNPPSVTTDRPLDLCEPCFPRLENGRYNSVHIAHSIHSRELFWGLKEVFCCKVLVPCLPYCKPSGKKRNVTFHLKTPPFHQLLPGMRDPPTSGVETVSPSLAGRSFTAGEALTYS